MDPEESMLYQILDSFFKAMENAHMKISFATAPTAHMNQVQEFELERPLKYGLNKDSES